MSQVLSQMQIQMQESPQRLGKVPSQLMAWQMSSRVTLQGYKNLAGSFVASSTAYTFGAQVTMKWNWGECGNHAV